MDGVICRTSYRGLGVSLISYSTRYFGIRGGAVG
jgi:hypothetical protein